MRKILSSILLAVIVAGVGYYVYYSQQDEAQSAIGLTAPVQRGAFEVKVSATGELQAERSEKIRGPKRMRMVGVFQTTITDIVAEGTQVEEGGYVATLDRNELANKMKSVTTDIEKTESQLLQIKLDTAIEMRGLRDQLVNLKFSMEEKKLEAKLNIYEPPAIQRQIQLDLERLDRDYFQANTNYSLKQEQAEAKVQEINATLEQHKGQLELMNEVSQEFVVNAPKAGMVIYERSWNGKKGPGSRVTAWDPIVAQLPDLSKMISVTYVNEVDISKVKMNQEVEVTIDAFPDNKYTGNVFKIANIGEQRPNFDAKVFEVKIQLHESDSILRPAMTTANNITTSTFEDVLFIPLEALHSNDSLSYVFAVEEGKVVKREVITGISNDQEVIVENGLEEGQEISLSIPNDAEKMDINRLPAEVREAYERKKREEAEARKRKAEEDKKRAEEMKAKMMKEFGGKSFGGKGFSIKK